MDEKKIVCCQRNHVGPHVLVSFLELKYEISEPRIWANYRGTGRNTRAKYEIYFRNALNLPINEKGE